VKMRGDEFFKRGVGQLDGQLGTHDSEVRCARTHARGPSGGERDIKYLWVKVRQYQPEIGKVV
jgi:hypothetical protein